MSKLTYFLAAAILAIAAPARAETITLTVDDWRQVLAGVNILASGYDRVVKDGSTEKVVREQYHFATPALDADAGRDFALVQAAIAPHEKALQAAQARLCPASEDCKPGEKDDARTKTEKLAAAAQSREEARKTGETPVTIERFSMITEINVREMKTPAPLVVFAAFAPLWKGEKKD